jgi:hypothetical protein
MLRLVAGHGQHFALDFNFAPSDEVSTYAQMYIDCVAQDRKSGLLQPSVETLNAKGEAIRRVQDTIAVCGNRVPQTIILAMALLAHGCVSCPVLNSRPSLMIRRVQIKRGMRREVMLKRCNTSSTCEAECILSTSSCKE